MTNSNQATSAELESQFRHTMEVQFGQFQAESKAFIKKSVDLFWFLENVSNAEKLNAKELKRLGVIKDECNVAIQMVGGEEGEPWKDFYAGILGCARYLQKTIRRDYDSNPFTEVSECEYRLTPFSDPIEFKRGNAQEGMSKKEMEAWDRECAEEI